MSPNFSHVSVKQSSRSWNCSGVLTHCIIRKEGLFDNNLLDPCLGLDNTDSSACSKVAVCDFEHIGDVEAKQSGSEYTPCYTPLLIRKLSERSRTMIRDCRSTKLKAFVRSIKARYSGCLCSWISPAVGGL